MTGVRNPAGLDVDPVTGELFAVVQERDGAGDDLVPDYLIRVDEGEFFGWPYSYMGSNPQPGFAQLEPALVDSAEVPDLIFNPHSAVMDLAFYDGEMFPERYRTGPSSRSRARGTGPSPPATRWSSCRSRTGCPTGPTRIS